jgi:hypothetical protein
MKTMFLLYIQHHKLHKHVCYIRDCRIASCFPHFEPHIQGRTEELQSRTKEIMIALFFKQISNILLLLECF